MTPRFGEVWEYSSDKLPRSMWMFVTPDTSRLAIRGAWKVVYLGPNALPMFAARIAAGRSILDSMSIEIGDWRKVA